MNNCWGIQGFKKYKNFHAKTEKKNFIPSKLELICESNVYVDKFQENNSSLCVIL